MFFLTKLRSLCFALLIIVAFIELSSSKGLCVSQDDPKIQAALEKIKNPQERQKIWTMTEKIVAENKNCGCKSNSDKTDFYIRIINDLASIPQDHWFMRN